MKKQILILSLLLGSFLAFTINAKAIWITGHGSGCSVLAGTCKWNKNGMPPKAINWLDRGNLVLFAEEPQVDVAAEVDIKVDKGKMFVTILKLKGTEKFFFDVEKDMPLEPDSAKMLGFRSVVIKKGKYSTCYDLENPNGKATLDVIAK